MNYANTSHSNENGAAQAESETQQGVSEFPPECDICNDSLWVEAKSETGQSLGVLPCRCVIPKREPIPRLRTYSQLGQLERMTFDTLMHEGRRGRSDEILFRAAIASAQKFAEDPKGWLAFEGSSGSGKTHLAAAIVNALIERDSPAKYVSALNLPDLLRSDMFDGVDEADSGTFISLLNAPVLVIDDLGAQQTTNWLDAKIDQLLTHRFNGRIPTVIALAKPAHQMPERIALKLDDPSISSVARLKAETTAQEDRPLNIPKAMLQRMTFETFDPSGSASSNAAERDSLNEAFKGAKEFSEQPTKWLYIHGEPGVGKTHIAVAIANARVDQGTSVSFWFVPELLDRLRYTYSSSNETSFYTLFDSVRNSELLILDDLATPQMTDWALEKLYQLISHRYDREMPTVITSQFRLWGDEKVNANWRNLSEKPYWKAILSRLRDINVVSDRWMVAPDYRDRGA